MAGEMTQAELSVVFQGWFCGCGSPESAAGALLRLLNLHPLFDHRKEFKEFVPDDGIEYLLLYQLDSLDLTEHGGTVGGGWLTDKGKAVRAALARGQADGFESLFQQRCSHGYLIDDDSHDCFAEEGRIGDTKPQESPE